LIRHPITIARQLAAVNPVYQRFCTALSPKLGSE